MTAPAAVFPHSFYPFRTDPTPGTDNPDRREIKLSETDVQRLDNTPDGPKGIPDEWITVTDVLTGEHLEVRRAPCGQSCKCDLQWQPLTGAIDAALADPPEEHHGVKVGDFFSASWGYDQTNITFYKVIGFSSSGKSVKVQRWSLKAVDDTHVVPGEGPSEQAFWIDTPQGRERETAVAEVQLKRLNLTSSTPHITADDHYASLWDGKPEYQTATGFGH
jgi:hypothetical protein